MSLVDSNVVALSSWGRGFRGVFQYDMLGLARSRSYGKLHSYECVWF